MSRLHQGPLCRRWPSSKRSCLQIHLVGKTDCYGLGVLPRSTLFADVTIWECPLAEQFVAQHIATIAGAERPPELYYWKREQRQSSAEIDFLVQHDR